ncbi:MAG: HD-GYP domain-containing protein [Acidimicrobiales bacterium]
MMRSRGPARTLRNHGLYLLALITPLLIWLFLRAVPTLDIEFLAGRFHLVLMTVVSSCALAVAFLAARASIKVRQPGVVLLAAGCLLVGILLLGHGLTTPFVLGQPLNQWVGRLPYLALSLFALCMTLAASGWARRTLSVFGSRPVLTLALIGIPAAALVAAVSWDPTLLNGASELENEQGLKSALAYISIGLLLPVSLLHWRRFRLGLDIVQASLSIAALMTAAAIVSLHFGELWRLSWWDYHGCLLAGFSGVAYAVFKRWGATKQAADVLALAFEDDPLTVIASNYPSALRGLVEAMETKDRYTHGHSARTASLAVSIGVRMGLDGDALRMLAQGAYLHDIGKLAIPDEILNKPGKLTPAERETINTHPTIGCDLAAAHDILKPCLPIIRHHHERFDGNGYPDGLSGEKIPLLARIAAVADVWDALITDRSYRPGWSPQRALDHIVDGAGHHLDPQIVAVLLDIASDMGITPSGIGTDPDALTNAAADCHEAGSRAAALAPDLEHQIRQAVQRRQSAAG